MPYCEYCGTPLTGNFCQKCGKSVAQAPAVPASAVPVSYPKKLYRSQKNKWIAGICGGIGEKYNIDPIIVRILWIILSFCVGIGVIAYLILWAAIKKETA